MSESKKDYYYYLDPNYPNQNRFKYRWDRIDPIIQSDIDTKSYKMTVRQHFYSLVDRDMLPNLAKTYTAFDKHLTYLRKNYVLPIDGYHDAGHPVTEIDEEYYSPDDWLGHYVNKIYHFHEEYLKDKQSFPRWYNQKNHVEIWIEKEAEVNNTEYFVNKNDLQVKIVSYGGFRGVSWFDVQMKRLEKDVEKGKSIHILYLGDFDPSGESMDEVFAKSMGVNGQFGDMAGWNLKYHAEVENIKGFEVTFERIAVTKEQIEQYNLPWNPESMSEQVQQKLVNDKRTAGFKEKHGKVYATEVSALSGSHPEIFEKVVTDSVNQYFDNDIYEQELKQHNENYTEDFIKETRNDWVQSLVNTLRNDGGEID